MGRLAVLIAACGCAGLIGGFIPRGESLWDAREDWQVFWIFACFVVAIAMGALAGLKPPLKRWHALVALEAFALVILKFRAGFLDLITDGNEGGRLIAGAVIVGILASGIAAWLAKPAPAKESAAE